MSTNASSSSSQEDDNTAALNANILAELIIKADLDENKDVCTCLRSYKLDASHKSLVNAINKFSTDILGKTLIFLNATETDWSKYYKRTLVNEVICRIQNLLVDTCPECNELFSTGLDEKLFLKCKLCGQNFHRPCLEKMLGEHFQENMTQDDVLKLLNPFGLKGFHYLCQYCSSSTIPQTEEKARKSSAHNSTVQVHAQSIELATVNNNIDSNKNNPSSLSVPRKTLNRPEIPWRERTDLCELFLEGKCPKGISGNKKGCDYHPKICNKYRKNGHSKYGCQLGDNCPDFHPEMCPNSLRSRTCYQDNCSYVWHLPGTARKQTFPQQGQHRYERARNNKYSHSRGKRWRQPDNTGYYSHRQQNYRNRNSNNCNSDNFSSQQPSFSGTWDQGYSGWEQSESQADRHDDHTYSQAQTNQDNNHLFSPFLVKTIQDSIAEQVQAAFQGLNISQQIHSELAKLQQVHPQQHQRQQEQQLHQESMTQQPELQIQMNHPHQATPGNNGYPYSTMIQNSHFIQNQPPHQAHQHLQQRNI